MTTGSVRNKTDLAPIQWSETLAIEVTAKPMPKTSMRGNFFVFGPTYGTGKGVLIEARAIPGGEPVAGAPCSISRLSPDTALTSGDLEMPVGETRYTDANGVAEFPVRYRADAPLHEPALLSIAGGESEKHYPVEFKKVPSDPDESTFMGTIYPGRPELGEAYAQRHIRIYVIAGKYNFGAAGMPPQLYGIRADMHKSDGSGWAQAQGNAELSEASDTISWRIDSTGGPDLGYDFHSMDVEAFADLEEAFHLISPRIYVKRDFPERFFPGGYTPFLYAPVRTARIGESIYLQWPTYTNHQPGEHYTLNKSPGLDIEIFPFTFGEVALARLTCNRDFSPVIDLERVVDGKSTVIDRVLLNWLGG